MVNQGLGGIYAEVVQHDNSLGLVAIPPLVSQLLKVRVLGSLLGLPYSRRTREPKACLGGLPPRDVLVVLLYPL